MEILVYEENKRIENDVFDYKLIEFKNSKDKRKLMDEYKNHNMRFSLIIEKKIAIERNEKKYEEFIDSVIEKMNSEICLLNNAYKNDNLNDVLKKFSLHDKINIIFYVRPQYYDIKYDPYEILIDDVFKILSQSIIFDANNILKKYNITLEDIKLMNAKDVHGLIKNSELAVDILYAAELIN